jgi:hypothetical protein
MKLQILALLIFLPSYLFAQKFINDFLTFDTVLYLKSLEGSSIDPKTTVASQKCLYIYDPNKSIHDNDSLMFFKVDPNSYQIDSFYVTIPDLQLRSVYYNYLSHFAIFDDRLIYLRFRNFISIHEKKEESFQLNQFLAFEFPASNFYATKSSIFFGSCYKYAEIRSNWSYIFKYDLKTNQFSKAIYPNLDNIEFCFFSPNKWIDYFDGKFAFSQTTRYNIEIYDSLLKPVVTISKKDNSQWAHFKPTSLFDSAKLQSSPNIYGMVDPTPVMDYLNRHIRKISRIESVHFADKNSLLVFSYHPDLSDEEKTKITKKIDIWDLKDNRLKTRDLQYRKFKDDDVLLKNRFPLFQEDSEFFFLPSQRKMIVLRKGGILKKMIGENYGSFIAHEEDYLQKNNEIIQIFIFDTNF